MDASVQVPHIISNSVIDLKVGTAFIADLQNMYMYLLEGHTAEEADVIKSKLQNKEQLTSWEAALITMSNLISTIHRNAKDQNCVQYLSVQDTIAPLVS